MARGRPSLLAGAALALALLLPPALAGCAGAEAVPAGIPTDSQGEALPTVHGVVVDEAIRPLAGAVVRFLGDGDEDVRAVTGEDGRYAIHRPTPRPQAMLVSASKPGFLTLTQQVQVSGHLSAQLGFVLRVDETLVPHVTVLAQQGQVRCTVGAAFAGQATGLDCPPPRRDEYDRLPPWMWDINPTAGLAGAVVEVHWDAQTPAAARLAARIRLPMAGGQGGQDLAHAVGESPLRLEVPYGDAAAMPRWHAIRLYVETADGELGTPGVEVQQPFDAFATLFYVDPAPPGYHLP